MNNPNLHYRTIGLRPDQHNRLAETARRLGVSQQTVVDIALSNYLARVNRKIEVS